MTVTNAANAPGFSWENLKVNDDLGHVAGIVTRAMASQHGPEGIRVNCVAPGMVYTPMVAGRMTPEMREVRRMRSLLQTEGSGWDVGHAVAFLASDEAGWVTGVVFPVDAGTSAGQATLQTLKNDSTAT